VFATAQPGRIAEETTVDDKIGDFLARISSDDDLATDVMELLKQLADDALDMTPDGLAADVLLHAQDICTRAGL
jgi:hypothetical protein